MKKRYKKWAVWFSIILLTEICVFTYYNQIVGEGYHLGLSGSINTSTLTLEQYQTNPHLISLSNNQQEIAYVTKGNQLIVKNVQTNKIIYQFSDPTHPFQYIQWISNDLLMIGNSVPGGNTSNFKISTVNLVSKTITTKQVLNGFQSGESIENITFSPYTNDIYILIGNIQNTNIYHIDTMSQLTNLNANVFDVSNIAVTQRTNQVFIQERVSNQNTIIAYHYGSEITLKNAKMIAVYGDTLYFIENNQLKSYNNGKIKTLYNINNIDSNQIYINQARKVFINKNGELIDKQSGKNIISSKNEMIVSTGGKILLISPLGMVSIL